MEIHNTGVLILILAHCQVLVCHVGTGDSTDLTLIVLVLTRDMTQKLEYFGNILMSDIRPWVRGWCYTGVNVVNMGGDMGP